MFTQTKHNGEVNMYKCINCGSTDTYVKKYKDTYNVKGIQIDVETDCRFCSKCNHQVRDKELDNNTILEVYNKYNSLYGIRPEEITALRESYGFSKELFAKIIGCARKTLISYENGTSIPNDNFYIILKMLLNDPSMINNFVLANEQYLTDKDLKKIKEKLGKEPNNIILQAFFDNEEDIADYNGYTEFNINKVEETIANLTNSAISKMKLFKELFYSDFVNYKNTAAGITGLEYVKYAKGPVPNHFEILLDDLYRKGLIDYVTEYVDGKEHELIISKMPIKNKNLSSNELLVINKVKEYFKDFSDQEISDYSHKEDAYIKTNMNELISYDYALDIKGIYDKE